MASWSARNVRYLGFVTFVFAEQRADIYTYLYHIIFFVWDKPEVHIDFTTNSMASTGEALIDAWLFISAFPKESNVLICPRCWSKDT